MKQLQQFLKNLLTLLIYNMKIVFKGKFIYFLIGALSLYVISIVISILNGDVINSDKGYGLLQLPVLLLIFYPACYIIQNDQDSKITEVLFGIPNYKYKIWLFRMGIIYLIGLFLISLLVYATDAIIVDLALARATWSLWLLFMFIGGFSFMTSTLTGNGNGTAVILIIATIIVIAAPLPDRWNPAFNPFLFDANSSNIRIEIAREQNMVFMICVIITMHVIALSQLTKRNKFI